ncbi:MAG: helix-turn-helix domain-containing protein [Negativicutes bacterium]
MAFDYILLGRKLKEARESLKMSIEEVSQHININSVDYVGIEEAGFPHIDGDKLAMLAQKYNRDFRYFVTGDYPSAESQIKAMFRQNDQLSSNDRVAIQQFVRLCEYKQFLESLIERTKPLPPDYSRYLFSTQNHKYQGGIAAKKERERLGITGPIENLFALLRKQRIHVFRRSLEDRNISGIYLNHPIAGHCILINYIDDLYRQNFSGAHEYCHAIFDASNEQNISYYQNQKSTLPEEWRANNFAGNFLVPEEEVKRFNRPQSQQEKINTILNMSRYFNANVQTICIRLRNIDWITDDEKEAFLKDKQIRTPKAEKKDPELVNVSSGMLEKMMPLIKGGLSVEYMELCRFAYQEGAITYGKMIEALRLPFEEGKEIADLNSIFVEALS